MNSEHNRIRYLSMIAAFALIAIGMSSCAYLLQQHLAGATAPAGGCRVLGYDCAATGHSDWGTLLGIPLSGWGLVHFSIILALMVLAVAIGDGFRTEGLAAALVLCSLYSSVFPEDRPRAGLSSSSIC